MCNPSSDPEALLSVGIDIGTTTTQLILSRLVLKNQASDFAVPDIAMAEKEVLFRSRIHFTPLLDERTIDAEGVRRIVDEFPDVKVLYPIHLNPAVRQVAREVFEGCERIRLIEPLEVFDFHNFQNRSFIILTDSGGIQEEAPSLGKPVLVLRDTTERPEGIEAGTLKLVGTDAETIYRETRRLLTDEAEYRRMSRASNPYGDGHASQRIADAIIEKFRGGEKA